MKLILAALCAASALQNQEISLVSKDPNALDANSFSSDPSISADGRLICFTSAASNLIPSDSNQKQDVYLYEHDRNQIRLISRGLNGRPAAGNSHSARISADGSTVVFVSDAGNLVANDQNHCADIFLHDLRSGNITRVAPPHGESNGASSQPCLSGSGRFVAFTSEASNWVKHDRNNSDDIFLYDMLLQTVDCLSINADSIPANGASHSPTIARDRSKVAFVSTAPELGAYADLPQIMLSSASQRQPQHVSTTSMGFPAAGACSQPSLSADGNWLAFLSTAANLLPGDRDSRPSIYLYHLQSGGLRLAVVDHKGRDLSAPARSPSLSADGRFVAFTTMSNRLNRADTNGQPDVYLTDRSNKNTLWVSQPPSHLASAIAGSAQTVIQMSSTPTMTADGAIIAFASSSPWLVSGDANQSRDIFLWASPTAFAVAQPPQPAPVPSGPGKTPSLYPKLPSGLEITPRVAEVLAEYYNIQAFDFTPAPVIPPPLPPPPPGR